MRTRPGSFQSENIIFVTYYNAGLRVFDIRNKFRPDEVGFFIPPRARRDRRRRCSTISTSIPTD